MAESDGRLGFTVGMVHLQSTPAGAGACPTGGESTTSSQGTSGVVPTFHTAGFSIPRSNTDLLATLLIWNGFKRRGVPDLIRAHHPKVRPFDALDLSHAFPEPILTVFGL